LETNLYLAAGFDTYLFNELLKFWIMKELVEKIKAEYAEFEVNAVAQAEKGNKAAGARARKAALSLMKDLKDFRKASVEAAK